MTGEVATLADLAGAVDAWGEAVLVLVAGADGSTPREAGAAMLVGRTALRGTIGGGRAEHEAVEVARALLAGSELHREVTVTLGPASDQCCGGRLRLAFARLDPATLKRLFARGRHPPPRPLGRPDAPLERPLLRPKPAGGEGAPGGEAGARASEDAAAATRSPGLDPGPRLHGRPGPGPGLRGGRRLALWPGGPEFVERPAPRQVNIHGAGHVGRALARALAPLPFRLRWIDSRLDGFAGAAVPEGCETLTMPIPEAAVAGAEPDAFHVVLTHSHAADLEIVDAVLARDAFAFLGLIGSASKKALFHRRLAERGHGQAALARLTCPIGLAGLDDKRPAVIAASVAAQLLEVERRLAAAGARAESPA